MTPHFILAGNLIDGSGGPIKKSVLLSLQDGIISAVTPFDRNTSPDPALVTDLSFATIAPPFIDCHVHLALSGTIDETARKQQKAASFDTIRPMINRHIVYLFRHGIMAAQDAGDRNDHVLRYQSECLGDSEEPLLVKTVCSGNTAQTDLVYLISSEVVNPDGFGEVRGPLLSMEEIRQAVENAEQERRKLMVHANGRIPVRQALEAGCHAIVQGYGMGRENLQLMAEKQVVLVPTLYAIKARMDIVKTADQRKIMGQQLARQLEQVALARELGVPVAVGTDSGNPGVLHGEAMVEEMKLLSKSGYSLAESIRCATSNGAQLLGIDAGLIAAGMPAHFLVTRGTPAQLPRKFSYLEAIYLNGKPSPWYRKNPTRGLI